MGSKGTRVQGQDDVDANTGQPGRKLEMNWEGMGSARAAHVEDLLPLPNCNLIRPSFPSRSKSKRKTQDASSYSVFNLMDPPYTNE